MDTDRKPPKKESLFEWLKLFRQLTDKEREEELARMDQRNKRAKFLALLESKSDEELEQLVVDVEQLVKRRTMKSPPDVG